MLRSKSPRAGFSLVEIVIAIGITAFTLAAIAGFFGVTSTAALNASGDTLMASMVNQVMSDLRSLPFDVLYEANPRGAQPGTINSNAGVGAYLTSLPPPFPYQATGPPANTDYYFSADGVLQPNQSNAFYHCSVTKTMDVTTKGFDANAKYNRMQLTLHFDWPVPPASASSSPTSTPIGPNSKIVYESIARYF